MIDKLVDEMRTRPYTLILLLILGAATGVLWGESSTYAKAADLTALKQQVAGVSYEVRKGALETHLNSIQSQLFSINRAISESQTQHKPIDEIYYTRLSQLTNEQADVERELAELAKQK